MVAKMSIFHSLNYRLNSVSVKIPTRLLETVGKSNLKLKNKRTRISKIILKPKSKGKFIVSNFRTYYKVMKTA